MRKRRQYSKTGLYHTVIRGVNKQNIFLDQNDKRFFIALIKRFSKKYTIQIHSYCLMDNHVHMVLGDANMALSVFMQVVSSVYARYFNRKYDRIGHLYQDRFLSEVIENNGYLVVACRYVIQNPERALICNTNEYKWSSYASYKNKNSFVCRKLLLSHFGNLKKLYEYLSVMGREKCIDISLRPSEKEKDYIDRIKICLQVDNPKLPPDIPMHELYTKLRRLKNKGFSIRVISRVTGIDKHIVARA